MTSITSIEFFYDPISPYAYLAFEQLPRALEGLSYHVSYTPILFGALLKAYAHLGPAEIAPKREWTYRQVLWQAKAQGVDFQMPCQHPFPPLPLLRLAAACADEHGHTNRWVTQQLFHHVWRGGADAADAGRLQALSAQLAHKFGVNAAPDSDKAKACLRANTDRALQAGLFGVPSLVVGGKVFWGLDSLPMLRECLERDPWFDQGGAWEGAAQVGVGTSRLPIGAARPEPTALRPNHSA